MADVKWIKIVTDIFDNEKILMIESMPDADALIVIWFKLLSLAGKKNNSGVFLMGTKPYTDEMFATIFRRPLNTVRMALNIFEQFGMIEIVNDAVTISNWGKYQSIDQIEAKNEYMKNYMKEYRSKQKLISEGGKTNSKTNSKTNVSSLDKSREKKEKIKLDKKRVAVEETLEFSTEEDQMRPCGNSGVVYLSDRQVGDLLDKLGLKAFDYYIDRLAYFIIDNNAKVKSCYETILKWANEDSQVKSGED